MPKIFNSKASPYRYSVGYGAGERNVTALPFAVYLTSSCRKRFRDPFAGNLRHGVGVDYDPGCRKLPSVAVCRQEVKRRVQKVPVG
ncbi:hypothetical protein ACLB1O_16910 [Escherichia coli]